MRKQTRQKGYYSSLILYGRFLAKLSVPKSRKLAQLRYNPLSASWSITTILSEMISNLLISIFKALMIDPFLYGFSLSQSPTTMSSHRSLSLFLSSSKGISLFRSVSDALSHPISWLRTRSSIPFLELKSTPGIISNKSIHRPPKAIPKRIPWSSSYSLHPSFFSL